ncbi:hypothetical protein SCLCIDRAFT_27362 [Scleroderma citrinum Foug A]|uniref:Uncharacterized protein n=1 Tax=Scleroderma citrinum Foug A TaxID=1036808 RepID=A0A0C3DT73_9AGAM|nr:hypothetical protein SCLCIDRAFT_27362 [Scleroderma citrinum Foug A]
MDTYPHYTPALEREICSNFACCGRSLSDLHELVDLGYVPVALLTAPIPLLISTLVHLRHQFSVAIEVS